MGKMYSNQVNIITYCVCVCALFGIMEEEEKGGERDGVRRGGAREGKEEREE